MMRRYRARGWEYWEIAGISFLFVEINATYKRIFIIVMKSINWQNTKKLIKKYLCKIINLGRYFLTCKINVPETNNDGKNVL